MHYLRFLYIEYTWFILPKIPIIPAGIYMYIELSNFRCLSRVTNFGAPQTAQRKRVWASHLSLFDQIRWDPHQGWLSTVPHSFQSEVHRSASLSAKVRVSYPHQEDGRGWCRRRCDWTGATAVSTVETAETEGREREARDSRNRWDYLPGVGLGLGRPK